MNNTHYVPHEWNVLCDVCGFKYKASALRKRWDGLMVCERDWETRHPQELIKTTTEKPVPWTRPEAEDSFVAVTYVDPSVGVQDLILRPGTFNNDL